MQSESERIRISVSLLTVLIRVSSLRYLLQEMQSAQCIEWSLILATALVNVPVISSLLREHPYHWRSYQKMLSTQDR